MPSQMIFIAATKTAGLTIGTGGIAVIVVVSAITLGLIGMSIFNYYKGSQSNIKND